MGKEENSLTSLIMEHLAWMKINCWRQNNHAVPILKYVKGRQIFCGWRKDKYHLKGKGDISGILPDGRRLEIECKAPDGTQSKEQKEFEAMIKANNGVYFCLYDWSEYEKQVVPYLSRIKVIKHQIDEAINDPDNHNKHVLALWNYAKGGDKA